MYGEEGGAESEGVLALCLPRNLSYAGESCLDRYSVSAAFVHSSGLEQQWLHDDWQLQQRSAAPWAEQQSATRPPRPSLTQHVSSASTHHRSHDPAQWSAVRASLSGQGRSAGFSQLSVERGGQGHTSSPDQLSGVLISNKAAGQQTRLSQHSGVLISGETGVQEHRRSQGPRSGVPVSGETGQHIGDQWTAMADQARCGKPVASGACMTLDSAQVNGRPMAAPVPVPGGADPTPCSDPSPFVSPMLVRIDRPHNPGPQSDFDRYVVKTTESPDSDLVSEEGIFVNMMDDLDAPSMGGSKSTASEASDDTCVSGDSMYYSPVEGEQEEGEGGSRASTFMLCLEEAVQQAAQRLQPPDPARSEAESAESTQAPAADSTHSPASDSSLSRRTAGPMLSLVSPHHTDGDSAATSQPVIDAPARFSGPVDGEVSRMAAGLEITVNDHPFQYDTHLSSSYRDLMSPESPVYEDREFNFTRSELRKSASLKSTKTPPGTPRRKKVVRFADAMGLDLESVRHVLNLDVPPKIPASAMKDLQTGLSEDRKEMGTKFIVETFPQPGADINFRDRILVEKIGLENALVVAGSITGVVRVANIGFHKAVRVRFTTNNWVTFHDIAASYMHNSNDGATDRFSFTLVPPADFVPGSRLEFAVSFTVNGIEYWDNNKGNNYRFECFAKTVPTESENAWMHFL